MGKELTVSVYTLTRDRLEFTKHSFASLREKAGAPYEHLVIDNGSEDGTQDWLRSEYGNIPGVTLIFNDTNRGISVGSNQALDWIAARGGRDYIIKMDNDCEVVTSGMLPHLARVMGDRGEFGAYMALSPRVEGIVNQPVRAAVLGRGNLTLGITNIIGGLFHVVPWDVYRHYRYPEMLPKAAGQDDHFCQWLSQRGVLVGYIEDLVVRHYLTTDGQAAKFPEYFKRKWQEEKAPPKP